MKNAIELRKAGDVAAEKKNYDDAVRNYMRSIELDSAYYVAYVHLAKNVFLEQNKPDEAIEYCQKALDIAGANYPYAYRIKGDAHKLKTGILLLKQ